MCWTFKKECYDCKYYKLGECTHPHYMYCNHSELWAPKWFKENKNNKGENKNEA